ncbi:MAG: DegV family protein [Dermatophilaceae bacterium]
MGVAIVTDSTASLTPELVADAGVPIRVVPLHVVVAGHEFTEGVDITRDRLVEALTAHEQVSTSRPAPRVFLDAYEAAAREGADAIVSIHISADMSGTVQSAQLAATQAPVPVTVVDSRAIGMAMGYAVLSAAASAAQGGSVAEVVAAARSRLAATSLVFYVDTLEHLRRGGRIGAAAALLGSALAIKPILTLTEGHIAPLEKVRTSTKAIARLEELSLAAVVAATPAGCDITVHHVGPPERAEAVADWLVDRTPADAAVTVAELGAVVGAHTGPGTLAVVVAPRVDAESA